MRILMMKSLRDAYVDMLKKRESLAADDIVALA
jgi:hypothetical protein